MPETTNYNLSKPTIGGDEDIWGDLLNANMDTIDAEMKANADAAEAAQSAADAAQETADGNASTINGFGTAVERDVGTGEASNLLDRDQLDGRLLRQNQNLDDLNNTATARSNLSVYSTAQVDNAIESRASNISQSDINSNAVGHSQLKTASGSVTISGDTVASLPGGRWSFAPQITATEGTLFHRAPASQVSGSFGVWIQGSSLSTEGAARNYYIQSSPPYDHGDGPVQGYVYGALGADGAVRNLYVSEDPPWYGNTRNTPLEQWRDPKTGKEYQRIRKLKCSKRDVDEGRMFFAEFMQRAGEFEDVVEEITPETKLRGMEDLPHPFEEHEDRTVVLLDPMDEKIGRLIRMMQAGESVQDLFNEGYLIVDNSAIKRAGPPGVPVHSVRWKDTQEPK